jgi:maltose alpha-D-glucosyltransferase/alpha-amylase
MSQLIDDPHWYRDGVIYEVSVRSYADSNGDGIGDLDGLTSRLDHIQRLGITAIWLLPIGPSPGRDDGYDVSDHTSVHPDLGTLASFKRLIREANARNIRVICELVLNHTSDQHPWFQRARNAPHGSKYRDWYVWSDTPDKYAETRIIFTDTETSNWTWDPVAGAYFWHRFFSHQPDLNYDNPDVRAAVLKFIDFWFNLGVAGLRLDAVPYLFEAEGTNCENLPATHAFLKDLRRHVDERFPGRMLLAEANQWPEDAAEYFGDGDECHMNFHFPVMPRIFMAVHKEQRAPIVDILEQTPEIPEGCQWATFLRNHDELTLEMVTDEERDYMYRIYAEDPKMRINVGIRRRLAPLLGGDRRKIELLNAILFSLPGTPIVYYGDEIGMGDNIYLGDRFGVRTPMQWSPDRNAGFSTAPPQRLHLPVITDARYHYESVNVEIQQDDPNSLLWWMSQLINLRKRHPVFGRGDLTFIEPENPHVLAYVRHMEGENPILVVANLSRHAQFTELDLSDYVGSEIREMFGQTPFPTIDEQPWRISLAPFGFFWFTIKVMEAEEQIDGEDPHVEHSWAGLVRRKLAPLEPALQRYLRESRWFAGHSRNIFTTSFDDIVTVGPTTSIVTISAHHEDRDDTYVVPLHLIPGDTRPDEGSVVARCREGWIIDAMTSPTGVAALFPLFAARRAQRPKGTELWGATAMRNMLSGTPTIRIPDFEQSNSGAFIDDAAFLKVIRRPEPGLSPEVELGGQLAKSPAAHLVAPLLASVDLTTPSGTRTIATVHELVAHDAEAWALALDRAQRFLETSLGVVNPDEDSIEALVDADDALRLGHDTASLHLGLMHSTDADMAPEFMSTLTRRALVQQIRQGVRTTLGLLRRHRHHFDERFQTGAEELLDHSADLLAIIDAVRQHDLQLLRFRPHGDLHLGQVLVRGGEHVFIDFEGEPDRPIGERRIKRTGLVDIAGMVRSYDYAGHMAARHVDERGITHGASAAEVSHAAQIWVDAMTHAYVKGYREIASDVPGLWPDGPGAEAMYRSCIIDKAAYELRYEMSYRAEWAWVPLEALIRIVRED